MEKILTVVVPTYNMEQYLKYCLDSLCVGTGLEDLEVLVVNDGSTDASSAIAHEYEKKHPQTFRVIDKENGNYGSCVNRGLSEARGKYIKILDADDSFDTSNFEQFIAFLKGVDADLVLSDFAVVDMERQVRKIIRYGLGQEKLFLMDDVCRTYVFQNMQMHAVAYRCERLRQLGYHQSEGISYTDQQWVFIPMVAVETVAHFDGVVYKYLIGRDGQTMSPDVKLRSVSHTVRCAVDMASAYEQYKEEFIGKPVQEYLQARLIPFVKDTYVFALTHYGDKTRWLLVGFDEALKEASRDVYNLIGSKEVSSFMGFGYIDYWRRHNGMNMLVVKLLSRVYCMMLEMKRKRRGEDAMALPTAF